MVALLNALGFLSLLDSLKESALKVDYCCLLQLGCSFGAKFLGFYARKLLIYALHYGKLKLQ